MYKTVFKTCFHSTNKGRSLTSSTSCFNFGKVYCKAELTEDNIPVVQKKTPLKIISGVVIENKINMKIILVKKYS